MNKTLYISVGIFLTCLIALVVLSEKKVKPIDWSSSFSRHHTRPYGAQVVFDQLGDVFNSHDIYTSDLPVYSLFADTLFLEPTAYMVINESFEPDEYDYDELLSFVELGNIAFLAAAHFSEVLEDSLDFRAASPWSATTLEIPEDSNLANFVLPAMQAEKPFRFLWPNLLGYFEDYPPQGAKVLATNSQGKPILLKIKKGEGAFILCSTPFALTNYHMLYKHHHEFISTAFSLIPKDHTIFWDEYYKVENLYNLAVDGHTGRLSFIKSQESLSWAWSLFVFSLLLFVAFERKRKQRAIPIIKPLPNLTLDFTETIGRLYFQSEDHKNIADKKIKVLLEYIRSRYYMDTNDFSPEFITTLSAKSEVAEGHLQAMASMIMRTERHDSITEDTLIELHTLIEEFYEKSAR